MLRGSVRGKDLRALEVLGQRSPEVGVLEHAQILGLGRVRRANQTGLHREVGLAETAACEKLIICNRETIVISDGLIEGSRAVMTGLARVACAVARGNAPGRGTYTEERHR